MDKIIMNGRERKQLIVFEKLNNAEINQVQAAEMLGFSTRWVRTKFNRYKQDGAKGLVHKNRGKQSPNKTIQEDRDLFVSLIHKEEWRDFGPTFSAREFRETYNREICSETARQIMISEGIWKGRTRKPQHRKRRARKEILGLMTQLDGSSHDWFEGRGPKCTLLVFIDDATSQFLWLEFVKSESFADVARATKNYIEKHGLPGAFYVDHASVFSVNTNNPDRTKITQFERALEELDIELKHARSPQAKGRVERANCTLQDHLVKKMRLKGISTIEEANVYLQKGDYIKKHNDEYAVVAEKPGNAHLPLGTYDLENILCWKNNRIVAKDFTISYKCLIIQLGKHQSTIVRPKDTVIIHEKLDSTLSIYIRNTKLNFTIIGTQQKRKPKPVDYVNQTRKEEDGLLVRVG